MYIQLEVVFVSIDINIASPLLMCLVVLMEITVNSDINCGEKYPHLFRTSHSPFSLRQSWTAVFYCNQQSTVDNLSTFLEKSFQVRPPPPFPSHPTAEKDHPTGWPIFEFFNCHTHSTLPLYRVMFRPTTDVNIYVRAAAVSNEIPFSKTFPHE